MAAGVLFPPGSDRLRPDAGIILAALADLLLDGDIEAEVQGRQSEQRTDIDAWQLAASRSLAVAERAERFPRVIFWADSRRRIRRFRRVIIKPNQFEAVGRSDAKPEDVVPLEDLDAALVQLRNETGAPVVVTRGADGMIVSDPEPTLVPGVCLSGPTDPTGAGDSATAGAVLALAAAATLPEAALVGNLVASITVEQLATTGTARPEQLPDRLQLWQRQRP